MRFIGRQGYVLLVAAIMLMFIVPNTVYAQLGGLANMAKGKAVEVLTDKVMLELEKKFTEAVAKEPISETAKANVVKKLSEIARPIVKRFVDGAASGNLPNPMALAQTVLQEVLPRVPEIVAAAKTDGGGSTVANAPAQGPYGQPTQTIPNIAVYVFGADDPAINKAMTTRLIDALSNSKRYLAVNEYGKFFEQATKEQNGVVAYLNSEQIKRLGGEFGVEYICMAEITTVLGEKQISAHIVNVKTEEVAATGVADSPMKTLTDITNVSEHLVAAMFKNALPHIYAQKPVTVRQEAVESNIEPNIVPVIPVDVSQNYRTNMYDNYSTQNQYENFTGGERIATWFLNDIIPGLGSATIMKDWTGFGFQISFAALGYGLMGVGALSNIHGSLQEGLYIGAYLALATSVTINIVRSATYKKPRENIPEPEEIAPSLSVHTFYALTTSVSPQGGGSVSRSSNQVSYNRGTRLTVTATPANGYTFTGWSGESTSTSASIEITMNSNKTLTANFKIGVQTSTFTDSRDGQTYNTIKIGSQTWMTENLKYETSSGSWCYDNDGSNCVKYGRLYDWNTAMTACPSGWHLSTDQEWGNLITSVGSSAGMKLKATSDWDNNGNGNNTDEYNFSALPGGKHNHRDGSFFSVGKSGYWWTADENGSAAANYRSISDYGSVPMSINDKVDGFSVRCIADN